MGSFSKIESTTSSATYELYDSGELVQVLHRLRFNNAMVAFLDCLKQLMDHVVQDEGGIQFPEYCQ
jgi:beclin